VPGESHSDDFQVQVANVAPTPTVGGTDRVLEGGLFELALSATDPAGDADTLTYAIDWGDGTAEQTMTAAQLAQVGGHVGHVFADDEDGPLNLTDRTVQVTVQDEDGGRATTQHMVSVENVAPTAPIAGAAGGTAGVAWTVAIGGVVDPGHDTVSLYTLRWGDGSSLSLTPAQLAVAGGAVSHTFDGAGRYGVSLDLTDEDGLFSSVAQTEVVIEAPPQFDTLRVGYAPARLTTTAPNAWLDAWSTGGVSIAHKANLSNPVEVWTPVNLSNSSPVFLSGSDVYLGDLGVSAQSLVTSAIRQEIDGTEGLMLTLPRAAARATIDLSALQFNDDALGFAEAGRVQAFDGGGVLVAEQVFVAGIAGGAQRVSIDSDQAFVSLVFSAGAYNGGQFIAGAYARADGSFGSAPFSSGGRLHGSEYLVDGLELSIPVALTGLAADDGLALVALQMGG
jgi:large repetitive protein